jgi:conjugal transfer/entry exclusion protein
MTVRSIPRSISTLILVLGLTLTSARAQFVGPVVVHDPINAVTLIDQKINQMTQIKNQIQQLQYELANLKRYSTDWSGVLGQVESLRAQVAANAPTVVNANSQLAQMRTEISELQQLESMSNSAQGSMQVSQTTNSLIAAVVSQMQKQRALTINAIQEEERNKEAAYAAMYGPSMLKP